MTIRFDVKPVLLLKSFLSIGLLLTAGAPAYALSVVQVGSASAATGTSVTVPISLNTAVATAAIEWTLSLPAGSANSYSLAPAAAASAAGKALSCKASTCLLVGTGSTLTSGPIATLTINLAPTAAGNLSVQLTNVRSVLTDGSADPVSSLNGLVTIIPSATSVAVTPAAVTLGQGATSQLQAVVTGPANSAVTWSVSPSGSGTVSAGGLYTAPASITAVQSVTVTATSVATPTASAASIVTLQPPAPVVSVGISPQTASVTAGGSAQFTASVTGSANSAVTWSVSPTNMGTVSATGAYTAPATVSTVQSVTVTATSVADPTKKASAIVSVQPAVPVVSVGISPQTATVPAAGTVQFSASITGSTNTAVTWSVSPTNSGTVSPAGLYTAPATASTATSVALSVTVTATSVADPTKKASAIVSVQPQLALTVSPSTANRGTTVMVTFTGSNFASGVTVSINNSGVAVSKVTVMSPKQLTALLTIASTVPAGTYTLSVVPSSGSVARTVPFTITSVIPPTSLVPTLVSLSPASGARGTVVNLILSGTNFTPQSGVRLSGLGAAVTSFKVISANQISAVFTLSTTTATGPHRVYVVTSAGNSNILDFTVN